MNPTHRLRLCVSMGFIALGLFTCFGAGDLAAAAGYARVGPRLFPWLVGVGTILAGICLTVQAITGRWPQGEKSSSEHALDLRAIGLILLGAVLHMATIGPLGFIAASTLLFSVVARAFGSRQLRRDTAIGLVLTAAAYAFFTRVVAVSLPTGSLLYLLIR